jgi:hypothetical protein
VDQKGEERRKLPGVDGGKLRPSETSGRKHSGELDVEPRQDIKKGSPCNEGRGTKRFVKMRIAARAHRSRSSSPHDPTCFLVPIVMLSAPSRMEAWQEPENVESMRKTQNEMNSIKIRNSGSRSKLSARLKRCRN